MNDVAELKKTKDRSPSFPYVSLERAIERARMFYAQEKRGIAPYTRAVLHWGMSESSSAALQTVSALKSYGLLSETGGSGKSRQLQLSDLALRILLDQRPESAERAACLREAARSPAVASDVYEKWPEHLPSDSTLSHYLVLERRFNEATVPSVIKILKENQQFAKLVDASALSVPMEITQDRVSEDARRLEALSRGESVLSTNHTQELASIAMVQTSQPSTETKAIGHTEQLASIDGEVTVSLHFSSKPDADFYEWIAFYASKKAEKMKQARKSNNQPDGNQGT
jgi:hypothetical protein